LPSDAPAQAAGIMRAGERALARSDIAVLVQADADFHQMIYRWSGNHVIESSMHVNWHHIRRAMAEILQLPDLAEKSWQAHACILKAMFARRKEDAVSEMTKHIVEAQERASLSSAKASD
ncbi:MAG: FCD domain-containing protein, partial [Pseudomonadota bacterium]